jgi:hypothetical protein
VLIISSSALLKKLFSNTVFGDEFLAPSLTPMGQQFLA